MGVLQFGNGLSVRTFQAPPAGFDPDKASDRERIVHGIPRCPAAFGALERRMRTKLKNFRLIEPKFEPRELKQEAAELSACRGASNHKQLVWRHHVPALWRPAEICRGNLENASRCLAGFVNCRHDQ